MLCLYQVKGQLEGKKVTAVAAGREHAMAVTSEGRVYSWGGRSDIAGREGNLKEPGLLGGDLANDTVLFVAGGEYFSLAASRHRVYGWGGNDYLCVGVGRNNPVQILKSGRDRGIVPRPAQVAGPLSDGTWSILGIAAGESYPDRVPALILMTNRNVRSCVQPVALLWSLLYPPRGRPHARRVPALAGHCHSRRCVRGVL